MMEEEREVCSQILDLQGEIDALTDELNELKVQVRAWAGGETWTCDVPGKGSILVSKPRETPEYVATKLNEEKLNEFPDLRKKLLEKGLITETVVKATVSKASVGVKRNV